MQKCIKRQQGCGRKEQALESRMEVYSAPHTGEQKQTTIKIPKTKTNKQNTPPKKNPPKNNQRPKKKNKKNQLQKQENVKVCKK